MEIVYKENIIPEIDQIFDLYDNCGWISYTKNLDILKNAFENSLKIITAWDGLKLIGVIRAVGDGYSIIYIQDILILKEYQRMGIGTKLTNLLLEKYSLVRQTVLMTDNQPDIISFYKSLGFDTARVLWSIIC